MLLRWLMEDRLSPSEWGLATLKEGDYVRESAITSWAGLGTLVNAANARLEAVGSSAKIDPFVVTIRNALAHGRVLHRGDDDIPTLVKFGTPQAGRVKVESVVVLSADNLNAWTKTIEDETMKVSGMVSAILEARNRLNGLP
jgi:hypothetical protein